MKIPGCTIVAVSTTLAGCGSIEPPKTELVETPPNTVPSSGTALFAATNGGIATIVRVDAGRDEIATLTGPLPRGFEPGLLVTNPAQDRFLVAGSAEGEDVVYLGTRDEWHALEAGWSWSSHSPSLDLVSIAKHDAIGRPRGARIVRFDGSLVADLGISLDPKQVGDAGFVAVEYELTPAEGDVFVRSYREKQPWWLFDSSGARVRLGADRSTPSRVFPVADGFALEDDASCEAFRWQGSAEPSATYPCEDVAPPLVLEGNTAYRARADGRDLVARVPDGAGGRLAALDPAGVSVFVRLRESDGTQLVTFVAQDGRAVTPDPGPAAGRHFAGLWTRVTTTGGWACALANRAGCAQDWTGLCKQSLVDVICSDGVDVKTRRFERTIGDDLTVTSGAEQFVTTPNAAYVLWQEQGTLHRLDTRSFEERVFDDARTFRVREGDVPNVFNRAL